MSFDLLTQPEAYISLFTLSAMEIVLGIDNVVFIAILVGRLPQSEQPAVRRIGLVLALALRLALLFAISWLMGWTRPLFSLFGHPVSGRDLIMLGGGLFLLGKATHEIYDKLEVVHEEQTSGGPGERKEGGDSRRSVRLVLAQIVLLDIVFSLDSVITAVGMAQQLFVMVMAMVIACGVMLLFAGSIGNFINRHPSMKMLALGFLLLIGVLLIGEGIGHHLPKGMIYFAMAFSLGIELLNMRMRKRQAPVVLHRRFEGETAPVQRVGERPA